MNSNALASNRPDWKRAACLALFLALPCLLGASGVDDVSSSETPAQVNDEREEIFVIRDNPFTFPAGVYPKDKVPEEPLQTLFLEAVIQSDGKRQAVINGFNFFEGDMVFGRQLIEIMDTQVSLQDGTARKILTLQTPVIDPMRFSLQVRKQRSP
ncbi:MAG: hypothetical protein G3M78_07130 [Candidatus Nitrohelix vancouverensis]|uniref:Uncharacterized protein n=1 Tax=Candidatus Nitrohelix vancouverensis TaxID=2705534 RepID=A0A7T0C255_9BACT|nr:MAG: hypothetical protein G3M78_07130 [Candidatus Nitrohelix vancouverensis]